MADQRCRSIPAPLQGSSGTDRLESRAIPQETPALPPAIIHRTYFGIYFAIEPEVTTVVAVLDMRNDPWVIRSLINLRLPKRER